VTYNVQARQHRELMERRREQKPSEHSMREHSMMDRRVMSRHLSHDAHFKLQSTRQGEGGEHTNTMSEAFAANELHRHVALTAARAAEGGAPHEYVGISWPPGAQQVGWESNIRGGMSKATAAAATAVATSATDAAMDLLIGTEMEALAAEMRSAAAAGGV
jgi:hypothetical protein